MVRNLYLIRHADAEDLQSGMKDIDRSLTRTGFRNAANAGQFLAGKNVNVQAFLSSTAQRARQTTETIADQLKYGMEQITFTEEIYEASTRILFRLVTELPKEASTVIMLGHNPGLTFLAEYLTGEVIGNVAPSGIVHLRWQEVSWEEISQNSGELVTYHPPENTD